MKNPTVKLVFVGLGCMAAYSYFGPIGLIVAGVVLLLTD